MMKKVFNSIEKIASYIFGIAGVVAAVAGVRSCISDLPPTLTIHYNGKAVESGDSCNVIVCVDDTTVAGACEQLFPVISNTTSHTAKDFAMTYTMTVDSVKILPKQSYFNQYPENNNTYTLKYTESSMPPQTSTKEPLGMLKLKGNNGVLTSSAFATHEGAEKPYTFNSYAKFLYVDSKNLDSKQWKSACRHAIMSKEDIPFSPDYIKTDIFYCSLAHGMTFEFDKHLFYTKEVPNKAIADPDSIAFVDPGVEEVIVSTLDTPMLSDTIGIISSSYKKNVWAEDSIEMTIANGYENDTTLYAVLQFQNLSTESIEVKYKPVVLKAGENELAFAIDNNQKFIDCTFINEHQYEEFLGGGDLSKKLLNNVITEETARKIFPFIISVILFILSWELYKRSKEDEEDNCYDKMDSENNKIIKIWNRIKKSNVMYPSIEKNDMILIFLDYLKHEKSVKDADVLMLYALISKDIILAEKAFEQGGNLDISFEEIVERYKEEYGLFIDEFQIIYNDKKDPVKIEDEKDAEYEKDIKDFYKRIRKARFRALRMSSEEKLKIIKYLNNLGPKRFRDPDVLMLYGIILKKNHFIYTAMMKGGSIDITIEDIIEKYEGKYETVFADKEPIMSFEEFFNIDDEGFEEVK